MKQILSKLYNSSPKEIVNEIREIFITPSRPSYPKVSVTNPSFSKISRNDHVRDELKKIFSRYQTSNLKSISTKDFEESIQARLGVVDAEIEGFSEQELDRQRDLSIKYCWGHNHDFGSFKLEGRMHDRHINLLANFIDIFPLSLDDFKDKHVFDVGCWTGGTTLLLAALAKKIFAIEEVKKYADTVSFLSRSFALDDRISVKPMTIYDCNSDVFVDRFDIVYFPGVIYHLSDPLLALRILYNSLKVGGTILVETAGLNIEQPYCEFEGSLIHHDRGEKERMNRGGWNWFVPSPAALSRMMKEAGFDEIQAQWHDESKRVYGYGRKVSQVGICKAGLSVPGIQ